VVLSVARATGIHCRSPRYQKMSTNDTSWRLENLEKSKDRSKASRLSTLGVSVSVNVLVLERAWIRRRVRLTGNQAPI
jgi:hypothetical protein